MHLPGMEQVDPRINVTVAAWDQWLPTDCSLNGPGGCELHVYSWCQQAIGGIGMASDTLEVTWFLDQLDTENSTWAFVKVPEVVG